MILLMAGTQDARMLASALTTAFPGTMLVATAVTEYGADLLRRQGGCVVLQQAMNAGQLADFIRQKGVRVLVDATHPFAENATEQARKAADITGIPYFRYERPATPVEPGSGVWFAADFTAAAQTAARLGKNIFLTIGVRHLQEFIEALPSEKRVVAARVLPDENSIRQCRRLGLSPAEIIALQGPVSQELNAALFKAYKADVIVSKDSGAAGGTPEKAAAARACRIPLILVRRPQLHTGVHTSAELIRSLRPILGN